MGGPLFTSGARGVPVRGDYLPARYVFHIKAGKTPFAASMV